MEQLFEEDKILICACHNSEHQILIHKDNIDNEISFNQFKRMFEKQKGEGEKLS